MTADAGLDYMQGAGQATAFVCQNFMCKAPTCSADKVEQLLSEGTSGNLGQLTSFQL